MTKLKYLYQKLTRGYSDDELWNLDETIAKFALLRIRGLVEAGITDYPVSLNSITEWHLILAKIIYALERTADIGYILDNARSDIPVIEKRIDEGTELFGKHFRDLCN